MHFDAFWLSWYREKLPFEVRGKIWGEYYWGHSNFPKILHPQILPPNLYPSRLESTALNGTLLTTTANWFSVKRWVAAQVFFLQKILGQKKSGFILGGKYWSPNSPHQKNAGPNTFGE